MAPPPAPLVAAISRARRRGHAGRPVGVRQEPGGQDGPPAGPAGAAGLLRRRLTLRRERSRGAEGLRPGPAAQAAPPLAVGCYSHPLHHAAWTAATSADMNTTKRTTPATVSRICRRPCAAISSCAHTQTPPRRECSDSPHRGQPPASVPTSAKRPPPILLTQPPSCRSTNGQRSKAHTAPP